MSRSSRACLLFDIDGTLVDSDRIHILAFNEIFGAHGLLVDEHTYRTTISGRANVDIMADLLPHMSVAEHHHLGRTKEALFRTMAGDMKELEGLTELLDWADSEDIPYAAVTNAPSENAEMVLRCLDLTHRFKAVVLSDDLPHAKPHPLPYLTGLERLAGDASQTVAFEDSHAGITAAHGAGLAVIGLTTSHSDETLRASGAILTAPDYRDDALLRLVRARTLRA